ncbi:hypothetical protein XENORESO_016735 [Xenotaenia resolanae]|uniref:Uncharacterized protein n=1 Tax=Xenotaenia resolanae TaxID=208358 RepID=A0ABV0WVM8_9TELE
MVKRPAQMVGLRRNHCNAQSGGAEDVEIAIGRDRRGQGLEISPLEGQLMTAKMSERLRWFGHMQKQGRCGRRWSCREEKDHREALWICRRRICRALGEGRRTEVDSMDKMRWKKIICGGTTFRGKA